MEFLKLTGTQARLVDSTTEWPIDSLVIFAVEDEKIIGKVAILVLPHIENLEIDKNNKNGFLMKRLLEEAENVLRDFGRNCAASFIMNGNDDLTNYAERIGYKQLPATVWIKPLV